MKKRIDLTQTERFIILFRWKLYQTWGIWKVGKKWNQ